MKRLLCILSTMNAGGAETFLMKIYRCLDREKYQLDFCINAPDKCFYEDEIISMGGRIFRIPTKSDDLKKFKADLYRIIKEEKYAYVLRITSSAMGFMEMKIAKKAGAKVCSIRSSNSSDGGDVKALMIHRLGRFLYHRYVDVRIAPSDLAAIYTFGEKYFRAGKVNIVNNGLDLKKYGFSQTAREKIREEFGIAENQMLFGNVGRFMDQKNHKFLLAVFGKILQQKPDSKLLLVGNGVLEDALRAQVKEMGIEEHVIFAGVRSDVPDVLSAMDVFVMTSLYEGMPNTVIEAQATGLPCVIADTITREADITGLVKYLPLGNAEAWAETVLASVRAKRLDTKEMFVQKKYDIDSVAREFTKLVFREG